MKHFRISLGFGLVVMLIANYGIAQNLPGNLGFIACLVDSSSNGQNSIDIQSLPLRSEDNPLSMCFHIKYTHQPTYFDSGFIIFGPVDTCGIYYLDKIEYSVNGVDKDFALSPEKLNAGFSFKESEINPRVILLGELVFSSGSLKLQDNLDIKQKFLLKLGHAPRISSQIIQLKHILKKEIGSAVQTEKIKAVKSNAHNSTVGDQLHNPNESDSRTTKNRQIKATGNNHKDAETFDNYVQKSGFVLSLNGNVKAIPVYVEKNGAQSGCSIFVVKSDLRKSNISVRNFMRLQFQYKTHPLVTVIQFPGRNPKQMVEFSIKDGCSFLYSQ